MLLLAHLVGRIRREMGGHSQQCMKKFSAGIILAEVRGMIKQMGKVVSWMCTWSRYIPSLWKHFTLSSPLLTLQTHTHTQAPHIHWMSAKHFLIFSLRLRKCLHTTCLSENYGFLSSPHLKKIIYLFLERGEEGERGRERKRNIGVWLPLTHTPLGTRPTIQACALTRNWTGDPLVFRLALNPLSHSSQGIHTFIS